MKERIEISVLDVQVRRGDDVSLPLTFDWTITGYTFNGPIYKQTDDTTPYSITFDVTQISSGIITISVPTATTTAMTEEKYYSYCQWTDTAGKKHTFAKINWEMV